MNVSLSTNLVKAHPQLEEFLLTTQRVAVERDRDIKTGHLHIQARCSRYQTHWEGTAHPKLHTWSSRGYVPHWDGKITMSIGHDVPPEEIVWLFSHELRHIGQFHRGRDQMGYLTILPQTARESEADANEFADTICAKLY